MWVGWLLAIPFAAVAVPVAPAAAEPEPVSITDVSFVHSLLRRDYVLLADDAVAAVALLATRRDVDPSRLGLWAQSEGAYVAPLACRRSSAVRSA